MTDTFDWTLLDRYLANDATPAEREMVDAWLQGDASRLTLLQSLGYIGDIEQLSLDAAPVTQRQVDIVTERVYLRTKQSEQPEERKTQRLRPIKSAQTPPRPLWRTSTFLGIGALAIICGIIGANKLFSPASPVVTRNYVTQTGQRAAFTLPDGSTVTLAPQSQLAYRQDDRGKRTIDLQGQAYFSVTHDASHPLTIHTGNVATTILGTAFEIARYDTDSVATVTVVEGKVAVSGKHSQTIVTPGMVAIVGDSTASTVETRDLKAAMAWVNGDLVFDDVPVSTMLKTLGRWYGYEFRLTDSVLNSRHVSVTYSANNPTEAMNILKGVLGVSLTVQGDTITLRRSGTTSGMQRPPAKTPEQQPTAKSVAVRSVLQNMDNPQLEAGK